MASVSNDTETPIGYAYFKIDELGNARLNYICIEPAFRRKGQARKLILEFIRQYSERLNSITLEVFDYNEPAQKMYESMGFVNKNTNYWYTRKITCSTTQSNIQLQNPETSLMSLKSFGFAHFHALYRNNIFIFGVPGPETIKCDSIETFTEDQLLQQFSFWLPTISQALLVTSQHIMLKAPDSQKVASSYVLTMNLETMKSRNYLVDLSK